MNKQKETKQQLVNYLNDYLENYEREMLPEQDELFGMTKNDVHTIATGLENGETEVFTKDEYVQMIKDLETFVDEDVKGAYTKRLKQLQEKDFDVILIDFLYDTTYFTADDFEEDEDEQEELETMEKQYLNDLLEDVSFDTTDLDDNWMEDEAGYYTTDLYEVNWALKYKRGVELADEQNVDTSQFEHDDYIQLAQEEMDGHREEIEQYLWNYRPTRSTEIDEKFAIFKCDVADLAKDFRSSEVYVYSKMEYLECLYELAYDADGQDREHFENLHEELRNRKFDVLVDSVNDYYYFV